MYILLGLLRFFSFKFCNMKTLRNTNKVVNHHITRQQVLWGNPTERKTANNHMYK